MTDTPAITKTAFARVMGVDRSQPTRWAEQGMPTLPDGTVDPVCAAEWVRLNVDPTQRDKRSNGARQARGSDVQRRLEATDQLTRMGIWFMAQRVPGLAAKMAVEAGLPVEAARKLHDLALIRAPEVANEVREMMQTPPGEAGPFRTINHPLPPEWAEWFKD